MIQGLTVVTFRIVGIIFQSQKGEALTFYGLFCSRVSIGHRRVIYFYV